MKLPSIGNEHTEQYVKGALFGKAVIIHKLHEFRNRSILR